MTTSFAIVRRPGEELPAGLTTSRDGPPDVALALDQHRAYCGALEHCGLTVVVLPANPEFPDGCFIEDTAILTPRGAIATRPGARSRQGEVASVVEALAGFFEQVAGIDAPGTIDGGDVCEADGHYLIGLSARTNAAGAGQLAALLAHLGYSSDIVDIRSSRRLLHLKTGFSYLGDGRMMVTSDVPRGGSLAPYELIEAPESERYAANCVRVNDRVLVAAGYPLVRAAVEDFGYEVLELGMSEFRKVDGGLSCLSLRG